MGCSTPLTEACVFRRQVTEVLDDLEQDVFTDFGKEILEEAAQSHKLLTMIHNRCVLLRPEECNDHQTVNSAVRAARELLFRPNRLGGPASLRAKAIPGNLSVWWHRQTLGWAVPFTQDARLRDAFQNAYEAGADAFAHLDYLADTGTGGKRSVDLSPSSPVTTACAEQKELQIYVEVLSYCMLGHTLRVVRHHRDQTVGQRLGNHVAGLYEAVGRALVAARPAFSEYSTAAFHAQVNPSVDVTGADPLTHNRTPRKANADVSNASKPAQRAGASSFRNMQASTTPKLSRDGLQITTVPRKRSPPIADSAGAGSRGRQGFPAFAGAGGGGAFPSNSISLTETDDDQEHYSDRENAPRKEGRTNRLEESRTQQADRSIGTPRDRTSLLATPPATPSIARNSSRLGDRTTSSRSSSLQLSTARRPHIPTPLPQLAQLARSTANAGRRPLSAGLSRQDPRPKLRASQDRRRLLPSADDRLVVKLRVEENLQWLEISRAFRLVKGGSNFYNHAQMRAFFTKTVDTFRGWKDKYHYGPLLADGKMDIEDIVEPTAISFENAPELAAELVRWSKIAEGADPNDVIAGEDAESVPAAEDSEDGVEDDG